MVLLLGATATLALAAPPGLVPATTQAASRPAFVPPPPPPPPDAGPPPAAFPLDEATTQAESTLVTLRSIEAALGDDRDTASIDYELRTLTVEIDSRLDETASLLTSSPSLQLLGEQEEDWTAIQHELNDWKHRLVHRHDQLKQMQGELGNQGTLRSDWDKEQALVNYYFGRARKTDLLQTAQASVSKTRTAISQTSEDVINMLIRTFTVQQAVDIQAARVMDVLESVREARDEAFNRLMVRNSPPIWNELEPSTGREGLVAQGQQSFGRQVRAVQSYLRRRRDHVGAQIGLLILLTTGLYWVRNRTQQWAAKQPQLQESMRVFGAPIATALVLSLLLSAWFYPQAPRLLWAIIGAAALIPTIIILRRLLDRRWYSLLDALVVFYFLDQLRSVAAIIPFVARVLLLVEMLGGSLLLISFIRSSRTTPPTTRIGKIVRMMRWLWLTVFLLAFLGDLIGYVSLADLMGDAALGSLYLAVILYACTVILLGLIVIALHSRPLCLLTMVRQHAELLVHRVTVGLTWTAVAAWALGVLASLSVASAAYGLMKKTFGAELSIGQIHLSLGKVLAFVFVIWVSVQLSRFIRFVLEEDVYDRFALPGGIPYAISKMLNYAILLIGFFFAVSSLGYDMTTFAVLGSAFAVGLGFGMQNIVNNFVSGLILLFERPVKVGDLIQMGDTTGIVGHIGIRASVIRTSNSAEIIVPNGNLISNTVTNWTLSNRQRGIEITLAAASTAEPKHVMELLEKVAAAQPLIIKSPAPQAFLTTFGADSFSYELRAWTSDADQWVDIRSDLSVAIHAALTKENIPIK